ncbi:MAG: GAF domain-containing protein [Candidatus Rokubacteria bacterium]|nr:GAF domain-containing protein [Candidatus Rokubacteria bacterium]
MQLDTLGLGRRPGTRLRPLALAIGMVISLGLPLTYYAIEYGLLTREATHHAQDLGERLRQVPSLGEAEFQALLGQFLPGRSVTGIHVRERDGRLLAAYEHEGRPGWWSVRPTGYATVGAGSDLRRLEVAVSQTGLLIVTVSLLLLSIAVGAGVAGIMYLYPVRVVRRAEAQVEDLITRQESLLEASRVLASTLDLRAVLDRLTEIARSLPGIDVVRIWLRDETGSGAVLHSQAGARRLDVGQRLQLGRGQGLITVVVEERRPVVLRDSLTDPRVVNVEWFRAEEIVSFLGVPLRVGDDCLGALACMSRSPRDWSRAEIALAETLGVLAAVAIRNARLFGESERRRRAAEALAEIGRVLAQALDPALVGEQVAVSVCSLLGCASSVLFRLEPDTGDLVSIALAGSAAPALGPRLVFPRGTGVSGIAVASHQPVVTADILDDPRVVLTPDLRSRIEQAGYSAVLVVPLIVKDRVIGTLSAGDHAGRVFGPDEIRLAQALADQAALALENARLYEEATERQREAEQLARVTSSLTESLDLAQVGTRIADSVIPLFQARSSGLFFLQPDQSLRAVAWAGAARELFAVDQVFPPGTGVVGRAVMWGAPIQSPDVLADPDVTMPEPMLAQVRATGNRAILAVPLHAKGELIGVLSLTDGVVREFSEDEIARLQTFADQAALAIENARLYQNAQQAYRELSAAQAQLVRGETLRAMGELASGVAHHLNNLLAVVLGRLQLARARHPAPQLDRHLELAERAALDGAEVVRRMRGFSRGQPSGDLTPVDLNDVAREVLELTRPRWQDEAHVRGIHIETRLLAGAIPEVPAESAALREVLMNLILNSIDALPDGGTITVRTWAADGAVHCEVGDTGAGMTPDVQRRALEPFFTTKGFQSTGLGLSVNYGIVRRHGGDVTIESRPGEGTRVAFWLPTAPPDGTTGLTPESTPATTPALRILVIDDEPEVRDVVTEILESEGHSVVQAASGREGLACLDGEDMFDLVLTDLGMPGMTGWEVARAAKAKRGVLRVGLLTGWGEQPAAKPEDRAAADFVVAKPVTLDGLRAALASVRPACN